MKVVKQFMHSRKVALVMAVILCMLSVVSASNVVVAEENMISGSMNGISWQLDALTGKLTITGSGKLESVSKMIDRTNTVQVKEIVVEQGITELGQAVFAGQSVNPSKSDDAEMWGNLKKITLPEGIKNIPGGAFYNCPALQEVVLPYGIEAIGDYAFAKCGNVKLELPDSLTYVGNHAFENTMIESLVLPDSVQKFGESVFAKSANLSSLTLPADISIKRLNPGMFLGCTALEDENGCIVVDGILCAVNVEKEEITVSAGVTKMLPYVFSGGSSTSYPPSNSIIQKVILPQGLTTISENAFACCKTLTEVQIPDSVTSIEDGAFYNCTALKEVIIPNSVTDIGTQAFASCTSMAKATISNGLVSMGDSAFVYCTNLEQVTMPETVEHMGMNAFSSCAKLMNDHHGVVLNHILCGTDWSEVFVTEDVQRVAVTISNLAKITVDEKNTSFVVFNDSLYTTGCDTLVLAVPQWRADSWESTMHVANACTKIADRAFEYGGVSGCSYDCEITIPPTVTSINNDLDFNGHRVTMKGVEGSYVAQYAQTFGYEFEATKMYASAAGDADGDGSVSLADAQLALKAALKIIPITCSILAGANVDSDSEVTLTDAQTVLKAALKIITLSTGEELKADGKQYEFVKADEDSQTSTDTQPTVDYNSMNWSPGNVKQLTPSISAPKTADITGSMSTYIIIISSAGLMLMGLAVSKRRKQNQ